MSAPLQHHRIPYRPRLDQEHWQGGAWLPVVRFFLSYITPYKATVLIGICLLTLHACSGYLLAYYSRIVVDRILVVQTSREDTAVAGRSVLVTRDRRAVHTSALGMRGALREEARTAAESPRPPGADAALIGMFLVFVLTLIVLNVAARWATRLRLQMSREVTKKLRDDLHRKVLSLSKAYHERHPPGRLLARILSDVDALRQQLMNVIFEAGHQIVMIFIGLILLLSLEWRMALVFLVVLVPYVCLVHYFQKRMIPVHREVRHTNSCMYGYVSQKLDAMRAIMAYGREAHEQRVFRQLSHSMFRDVLVHERLSAGLNLSAALVTSACTLGMFVAGSTMVMQQQMSLGEMLFAYSVTATLFTPVISLTQIAGTASSILVLGQRMMQILEEQEDMPEDPGAVDFPVPMKDGVLLRNVRFGYGSGSDAVLRGISLKIPAGQWVCIMGPSGSGKSTLLHLISRLYDPQDGQVVVDGEPIRKVRFASLRRHMALVPQEAQIFTGSIRDNITYGDPDATPREIMDAARAAEAHDFIMALPVQYETLVGEKGTTLSGGQRQRISIARALLTKPEVLLLDDVTSALDAETEQRIQQTLAALMVGKTAVIVSQRVSMAMRCHKICILSNGVFTEAGTHRELVERNGYYAQLVAQQMR
ncbi:MAG: ABC transporter ATP-binding protein [Kiritimatiellia bacterium]